MRDLSAEELGNLLLRCRAGYVTVCMENRLAGFDSGVERQAE